MVVYKDNYQYLLGMIALAGLALGLMGKLSFTDLAVLFVGTAYVTRVIEMF